MNLIFTQFLSVNSLLQLVILVLGCTYLDACLIGPVGNNSDSECCYGFYRVKNICKECQAGYFGDKCSVKCIYPENGKSCGLKCNCSISHCHNEKGCSIVQQVKKFRDENSTDEENSHTTNDLDTYIHVNNTKKVEENKSSLRIFIIFFGIIISSYLTLCILYELYIFFYKMLKEDENVNISNNEENIYAEMNNTNDNNDQFR
ncbi:uncharacterized protein LOC134257074 [Saccostrea cucullata]|uniref:uncharacterized protein LOC134257074 n=1 Tax=Saccostrea cuccullata TaxID=36930 RepID=UPI002ED4B45A